VAQDGAIGEANVQFWTTVQLAAPSREAESDVGADMWVSDGEHDLVPDGFDDPAASVGDYQGRLRDEVFDKSFESGGC
jgi:hypothetical protein